jgi:uncharacterized protein (DUF2141 family)
MKKVVVVAYLFIVVFVLSGFNRQKVETHSLTVQVLGLRNSNGIVQFALYNDEDSFPDEHYKKYYRKQTAKIINGRSEVTFKNLPPGKYAVNVLHDENEDGKVKKGIILPKEGLGFSNYESIGLSNRPSFQKASFNLVGDKKIEIKIIYM